MPRPSRRVKAMRNKGVEDAEAFLFMGNSLPMCAQVVPNGVRMRQFASLLKYSDGSSEEIGRRIENGSSTSERCSPPPQKKSRSAVRTAGNKPPAAAVAATRFLPSACRSEEVFPEFCRLPGECHEGGPRAWGDNRGCTHRRESPHPRRRTKHSSCRRSRRQCRTLRPPR